VVEEVMTSKSMFEEERYLRVLRPFMGVVEQRRRTTPIKNRNTTGVLPLIFEPLPVEDQPNTGEFTTNSFCPLLYSVKEYGKVSGYMDANPSLVVAQQFWNGMQVSLLLLMVVVHFKYSIQAATESSTRPPRGTPDMTKSLGSSRRTFSTQFWLMGPVVFLITLSFLFVPGGGFFPILVGIGSLTMIVWMIHKFKSASTLDLLSEKTQGSGSFSEWRPRMKHYGAILSSTASSPSFKIRSVRCLVLFTLCVLPFATYVSSPGGHIFTCLCATWIVVALMSSQMNIRLSLRDTMAVEALDLSPPRTILFEESLGFFCTLGSSLYNFAGHTYVWPHWRTQFRKVDRYMGWRREGDVTCEENWTVLGLFQERGVMPPFVPRANIGTTTGAQVFWIVWSVLPFLYCCYFICMILLSQRTPTLFSRWIQRFASAFGILHFMFGTDVVHYRYGRGYRNPHSELFHWTEKW
jgi:hypothetical protein